MKKAFVCFVLVWAFVGFAAERPAAWAVKMERAGLPNLHHVDAKLYRSAQPLTARGGMLWT